MSLDFEALRPSTSLSIANRAPQTKLASHHMTLGGFRQCWAECRSLMASDTHRYFEYCRLIGMEVPRRGWLNPAQLSVRLYRLASFFHRIDKRWCARLLWHLNLILTGADISPGSIIGPGFVILYPVSVTIAGIAGRNFTVVGHGGLGAGLERMDIGAGLGLPVVGDDVVLPMKAGVLGAVRIGDRVRFFPGCIVTRDVPADAVLEEIRPIQRQDSTDSAHHQQ